MLLFVNRIPFLKVLEKHRLLHACSGMEDLLSLSFRDLEAIVQRRLRPSNDWHPHNIMHFVEVDLRWLERNNVELLSYYDQQYPARLRTIYDPPILLFVRGTLPAEQSMLAIVGTRKPTEGGRTATFSLAREASESGIPVYSGLARGIDGIAHRGVISTQGVTVAVLGSGIDRIYPASNKHIVYSMLEHGGALISEYSPSVPPLKYHFPARNRIISALVDVVIIMQAPQRSGALITADYALEQGKTLVVHHVGLESEGTKKLIEDGAPVISNIDDLGEHLSGNFQISEELPLSMPEGCMGAVE